MIQSAAAFTAKHGGLFRCFSKELYRNDSPTTHESILVFRDVERDVVGEAVADLPDHPDVCLANVRGIVDRVLDPIWSVELDQGKVIPPEYFTAWQFEGEKGAEQYWNGQFPQRRGHQVRLLQLLTGTDKSSAKAKVFTKATYVLVNAAQGFSDFGQHLESLTIDFAVAFVAMCTCLELAASFDRELRAKESKK